MPQLDDAIAYAKDRHTEALNELIDLLSIPSVSTLPEHQGDVLRAGEWLAEWLRSIGMEHVEIMPTPGHPVVYGDWLHAPDKPTVLVYGHYDVQPADPFEEWDSPPFEPTVRGDNLYARGASDMKGQIFAHLKAMQAITKFGDPPVNIKYLLEGEEEIGSPNLAAFVRDHKDLLHCDFVLNCDSGIQGPELPGIIYGLRGLAYFELEIRGPSHDLHSGFFGGSIRNPLDELCRLVAGMHDDQGRVTLPGFYDKVRPLSDDERADIAKLPHPDSDHLALTGAPALWGEEGYTTIERIGARPALDVNGIIGGFTGAGSKTVLPSKAMAKISMRLVPDQRGDDIRACLDAYMEANAPNTITWKIRELAHGDPAITDRESEPMRKALAALKTVWGVDPVFKREGGSIPVVSVLQQELGVDTVMLGFALPTDGIHGPNEKQYLPNFYRGIETYIRYLCSL
jgi:acetylornithine deacetylase/succinyl-diaminopimelate desuccinylase-like protein